MKIRDRILEIYNRKYDFYYLRNIIDMDKISHVSSIIGGSSYSCFGVNPDNNMICIGLPSQDFFYSDKLIRSIIEKKSNEIKNVVFITGYYSAYCDLSQTKAISEQLKIEDVYAPILNNRHNQKHKLEFNHNGLKGKCKLVSEKVVLFGLRVLCFKKPIKTYFERKNHSREIRKRVTWSVELKKKRWCELPESERISAGQVRVNGHEKFFKYDLSYKENVRIFQDLYLDLKDRGIKFYLIISPFSKEYLDARTEYFKHNAYDVLTELRKHCDFFCDLNDCDDTIRNGNVFQSEDFVDADHMSDLGAKKMTEIIRDIIRK